jgi:phosphatidate cytidylyltransferase
MLKRVLLSAALVPVLACAVYADFLDSILFFLFVLSLSALASRELFSLVRKVFPEGELDPWAAGFIAPAPLLIVFSYLRLFMGMNDRTLYISAGLGVVVVFLVPYVLSAVRGAFRPRRSSPAGLKTRGSGAALLRLSSAIACVFIYAGVFPLTIFSLRLEKTGRALVYALLGLAWLSDASAYFAGSLFGRTKGIVKASPNKSLEGYAASFAATVGVASALPFLFPGILKTGLPTGLLVAVLAPLGDLAESALKRRAGVKDSSRMLPAFGGVLDIFDSIFICAPFYFILVKTVI